MSEQLLLPFVAASVALVGVLATLVALKKVTRDRVERTSRRRTLRFQRALAEAEASALQRVLRSARWTPGRQLDLASALARAALSPERSELVQSALARAGIESVARSLLRSRRHARRTRGLLLSSSMSRVPLAELAPLLADPDPDLRLAAARAVARRESPAAARILLGALRARSIPAPRLVERIAGRWSVPVLVEALAEESDPAIRGWLAEAIGLAADPAAAPALVRLLAVGDEEERVRCCRALRRLGLRSVIPSIVRALDDPAPSVRAQALRTLAEMPDERSLAAVAGCLVDRSWWVRANAAMALLALGESGVAVLRLVASHHRDRFARERAAEALAFHAIAGTERAQVA